MKPALLLAALQRASAAIRARRTVWLAAGALGFGALAVLGARNYIAERLALETAKLQPRQDLVEVVVAKRDLRRGDPVGSETMALRALPREFAPGGAVLPDRFDAIAGSRLVVPMRAGEPLLAASMVSAEAASISARVRPGIRAMTIAVDEVNSLSGMLQPGDRIDLLLSVRPPGPAGLPLPEITRTVMQSVPVLATGRQSRAVAHEDVLPARTYTSITVEVDPQQAQQLVVAQRSGKLTAVLRNPDDRLPVVDRRLDVNTLLGLTVPAPPVIAAGPPTVEVIVGGRGQIAPSGQGAAPGGGPAAPSVAPTVSPPVPDASGAAAEPRSSRFDPAPRPADGDALGMPALLPPASISPVPVPLYR